MGSGAGLGRVTNKNVTRTMPSAKAKNANQSMGLPSNVDAERFILGSIMLDTRFFANCATFLKPEDFTLEKHRRIYRRMAGIHERGEHIDRVVVANELMVFGELESVGGLSYLASLDEGLPAVPSIDSYIAIVREKSALRRVILLSQRATSAAMLQETPSVKLLQDLGRTITRMQVTSGVQSTLQNPLEIMEGFPGGVAAFLENSIKPGIPTGFAGIDEKIMGMHMGGQYVIAGSTGSGKSAFSSNIAVNMAKAGIPVAVFSLEMSKELLIARAICAEAEVPLKGYVRGNLMSDQRQKVLLSAAKITELPLYIDDTAGLTISELYARVGRAVSEKKVKVFVLDYLQILDYQADKEMKFRTEYEAVTYASRTCRLLARNHGIVSIVLSQLSRPADKRKQADKPTLNDLRSSGSIEQDAVAVMLIWRPELYAPGKDELRGKAEILIRKSRMGEPGTVNLEFKGRYTKFVDTGEPSTAVEDD